MAKDNPYSGAPAHRRWSAAVSRKAPGAVDPVVAFPFRIAPDDKVVTAGSCFAQHIARHLRSNGFGFLVTETAHPILPAETAAVFQYGVYSARYGNIYTSRQLLQLLRRAYRRFRPDDDVWRKDGAFLDPFRPAIQPGGFPTLEEYEADRRQHFAAVRRAFEEMDVFVFTLGLTECWAAQVDGAVYPVCPGVRGGVFDPERHVFINLTAEEVVEDMSAFLAEIRLVNPKVRVILTVSPVALAATAEDRHVVVSTAYSKAVLRVAAETLSRLEGVHYFPSYEVIVGPGSRGDYLADDRRDVTEAGVERVMALFFAHATTTGARASAEPSAPLGDDFLKQTRAAVDAICEEAMLDPGLTGA